MLISSMSHVNFKTCICRPVDFKGKGFLFWGSFLDGRRPIVSGSWHLLDGGEGSCGFSGNKTNT